MVEFNPDGSLKLPERLLKKQYEDKKRLDTQRCIEVRKEILSFTPPKKCRLNILLSEKISDDMFIFTIYEQFKKNSSVPSSIRKVDEKNFEIDIGTDIRRCSDCQKLIGEYREFLDGNVILKKGACTFEGKTNFSYEDYFE